MINRAKHTILLLLPVLLLSLSGGCGKIQGEFIEAKNWELEAVYLNNGQLNQMESFLPGYGEGDCCHYYINFNDDGTVRGEYWVDGALDYFTIGEWEIVKRNEMYIKMDAYTDGVFHFEKEGNKLYKLHSTSNIIEFYDVVEVEMTMMSRIIKQ